MIHLARRTFLAGAATLAAVRAASRMQIQLSCGALGIKADMRQAAEYAARYGFDVIDANTQWLASSPAGEVPALLEFMKAKSVGWGTSGVPVDFRTSDAAFEEGIKAFPSQAKALQKAGVKRMTTWISPASKDRTYVQNLRIHARRLAEICRVLGDHGLRFGLEYVGPKTSWTAQRYPFVHSMAEMKDLIAETKQPIGFVLDSWHWYTAGETEADLLTLTAKDVISVDLNDAPAGLPVDQQMDLKRELPGATGAIDARTFLGALDKIGFDGPARAEPFNEPLRKMPPDEALKVTIAAMKKAFGRS